MVTRCIGLIRGIHMPHCIIDYSQDVATEVDIERLIEAVHVGAALVAGDTLAHATQMRKIIKKKEMKIILK